ncbi:MAG: alpha/beta hydrolase [Alphaproteobacteria bacterium]
MLHYRRAGSGHPLVLLHGFVGGSDYWVMQELGLKHGFDIISVDLPGFAKSAAEPEQDSLEGYANSVLEVTGHLGIEKFSLLGFSMGGMIAQELARRHPEKVETLILYGSAAVGDLPSRFESWEASIQRLQSQGVEATTDKTVATWFVDGEGSPFHKETREACAGASLPHCIKVMRAMQGWSSEAWMKDLTMPTLVIVGDLDRSTTPDDSYKLWQGIPNAEFCILPHCAHGVHIEEPELFNRVLEKFLIRHTR